MKVDELRIRNVDSRIVMILDSMAKKRGMNRSEYLKGVLTNHALAPEVKEVDERYREMFGVVVDSLEGNAILLHEILVELQGEKNDS